LRIFWRGHLARVAPGARSPRFPLSPFLRRGTRWLRSPQTAPRPRSAFPAGPRTRADRKRRNRPRFSAALPGRSRRWGKVVKEKLKLQQNSWKKKN